MAQQSFRCVDPHSLVWEPTWRVEAEEGGEDLTERAVSTQRGSDSDCLCGDG